MTKINHLIKMHGKECFLKYIIESGDNYEYRYNMEVIYESESKDECIIDITCDDNCNEIFI